MRTSRLALVVTLLAAWLGTGPAAYADSDVTPPVLSAASLVRPGPFVEGDTVTASFSASDVRERFAADAIEPAGGTPEAFAEHLRREIDLIAVQLYRRSFAASGPVSFISQTVSDSTSLSGQSNRITLRF